jgi:hypothetical protein
MLGEIICNAVLVMLCTKKSQKWSKRTINAVETAKYYGLNVEVAMAGPS